MPGERSLSWAEWKVAASDRRAARAALRTACRTHTLISDVLRADQSKPAYQFVLLNLTYKFDLLTNLT